MAQGPQMGGPDFAAWGMNDVTAQFGMQLGQSAVAAGQDYVQKNVCPFIKKLTHATQLIHPVRRFRAIDNLKTPL